MPPSHEHAHRGAPKGEGQAEGMENLETGGGRRFASVTGQMLREHFHLPLHTVAQKFGMCTTAFKKMCRRLGIAKWPHRQVGFDLHAAACIRPPLGSNSVPWLLYACLTQLAL